MATNPDTPTQQTQMTSSDVATRVAAVCAAIQQHGRTVTGTTISGRRAAAISAMIDDVAATAAEGKPRAHRRKRRMANARGYKQEGRRFSEGQGERAFVVRARHRGTGEAVAVKSLHRGTGEAVAAKSLHRRSGGSSAAAVLREACFVAAAGRHPSLVTFRTVARVPGTKDYSIVMDDQDHVVGAPSLRAAMADSGGGRPFTEAEARRVMRRLLAGAEAMHGHGVLHRDIKPDNILLVGDGDNGGVKICNFAAAKSVFEKDPPPLAFAGTLTYMAPEVLVKNAGHGTLVDSWSLGCVMAEMLTGKAPFAGKAPLAGKDIDEAMATQLFRIFDVLGVPCKKVWQALGPQAHDDKVQVWRARQLRARHGPHGSSGSRNRLRELVPEEVLSGDGFQVLKGLLTCDPEKRLTAAAALRCPWFTDNNADDDDDGVASKRTAAGTVIAAVASSKPWSLAVSFVGRALGLVRQKMLLQ